MEQWAAVPERGRGARQSSLVWLHARFVHVHSYPGGSTCVIDVRGFMSKFLSDAARSQPRKL